MVKQALSILLENCSGSDLCVGFGVCPPSV